MKTTNDDAKLPGQPDIESIIVGLSDDDAPIKSAALSELSDLSTQELRLFDRVWPKLETKRRLEIVSRLVGLAEDNFEFTFDGIFKRGLKDPDERVRIRAIEGLWENEESSFMETLIDIMEKDSSMEAREAAANALGRFGLLAEHDKLPAGATPRISQALLGVYRDARNPVDVRRRALEALSPLSLPEVREAILEAYRSGDFRMQVSAVYAMGKNCHPDWLNFLLDEMDSEAPELRYEAVMAAGDLGEEPSVPRLIELTEDEDPDVRLAAMQALGKIGGLEAREHLELYMEDPSEAVRQVAEQALSEIEMTEEPTSIPWMKMRRPE